ncbi:MAG: hypothetical protein JWO06_1178 [Bacteroidota bacterium]|nr:hypothetical protein [Bacteroidota bacterium]
MPARHVMNINITIKVLKAREGQKIVEHNLQCGENCKQFLRGKKMWIKSVAKTNSSRLVTNQPAFSSINNL